MRKRLFFGIGILLICLAGWGIYTLYKPHRNVEGEDAVATLTALNLYKDFAGDDIVSVSTGLDVAKDPSKILPIAGGFITTKFTAKYLP